MATRSRLERFGEWLGSCVNAPFYLLFTCFYEIKAARIAAKSDVLGETDNATENEPQGQG